MTSLDAKMDHKFDIMMKAMSDLTMTMTNMKQEIKHELADEVKMICKTEIQEMSDRITNLESKKTATKPPVNNHVTGSRKREIDNDDDDGDNDANRKRQILVSGVGNNTADVIIATVEGLVAKVASEMKGLHIGSFGSKKQGVQ